MLDLDARSAAGRRRVQPHPAEGRIRSMLGIIDKGRAADKWLGDGVDSRGAGGSRVSLTIDLMTRLQGARRRRSDRAFLAQPQGSAAGGAGRPARDLGLDPGIRTGVKVAVVDATGKVLDTATDLSARAAHAIGTARSRRSARWRSSTRSRSSPSATAPPAARPTSSSGELIEKIPGAKPMKVDGVRSRCVGLFGLGTGGARSFPISTCRCAARCRSRGVCRIRSRNWSRSIPRRSASASISTTSIRRGSRARSMPSSRIA